MKTVNFDSQTQEVNAIVSHDAPTTRNKNGNQAKTPKSEKYYAVPEEDKRNYNIERPNLGKMQII